MSLTTVVTLELLSAPLSRVSKMEPNEKAGSDNAPGFDLRPFLFCRDRLAREAAPAAWPSRCGPL
jgi:hypothetical protein